MEHCGSIAGGLQEHFRNVLLKVHAFQQNHLRPTFSWVEVEGCWVEMCIFFFRHGTFMSCRHHARTPIIQRLVDPPSVAVTLWFWRNSGPFLGHGLYNQQYPLTCLDSHMSFSDIIPHQYDVGPPLQLEQLQLF